MYNFTSNRPSCPRLALSPSYTPIRPLPIPLLAPLLAPLSFSLPHPSALVPGFFYARPFFLFFPFSLLSSTTTMSTAAMTAMQPATQASNPSIPPPSSNTSSAPAKRRRRPPPLALPHRPPTSLPLSFYPSSSPPVLLSHPSGTAPDKSCQIDASSTAYASAHSRKGTRRHVNEDRFAIHHPVIDSRRSDPSSCLACYSVGSGSPAFFNSQI